MQDKGWLRHQPNAFSFSATQTAPSKPAGAPADVSCFDVVLAAPLAAQGTASLDVSTVYYNKLGLYPAEIEQTGTQLTMLRENSYVWSPYAVSAQTTEVRVATVQVAAPGQGLPALHHGRLP